MPETGEHEDADRQGLQEMIVALERSRLAVSGPVRPEDDLRHLARVGPARGDQFGALRRRPKIADSEFAILLASAV